MTLEMTDRPITRNTDYLALRLRGLAGLLRAGGADLRELTNLEDVTFFIATTLDEIATLLEEPAR